jgi:hypothetical protein
MDSFIHPVADLFTCGLMTKIPDDLNRRLHRRLAASTIARGELTAFQECARLSDVVYGRIEYPSEQLKMGHRLRLNAYIKAARIPVKEDSIDFKMAAKRITDFTISQIGELIPWICPSALESAIINDGGLVFSAVDIWMRKEEQAIALRHIKIQSSAIREKMMWYSCYVCKDVRHGYSDPAIQDGVKSTMEESVDEVVIDTVGNSNSIYGAEADQMPHIDPLSVEEEYVDDSIFDVVDNDESAHVTEGHDAYRYMRIRVNREDKRRHPFNQL